MWTGLSILPQRREMLSSEGPAILSTSFRLVVPRPLYEEMLDQARAELPNECCGILAGKIVALGDQHIGQVARRYPLVNALASPVEYNADVKGLFQAERDMRALKIDTLAIYHSHPTTHPVPSKTDRERLYSEQIMCMIISLQSAEPVVRAWWLTPASHREAEWELAPG
jgi:proteasome lid subunit RPN8/RPN11